MIEDDIDLYYQYRFIATNSKSLNFITTFIFNFIHTKFTILDGWNAVLENLKSNMLVAV
jgi:hypothetical protein